MAYKNRKRRRRGKRGRRTKVKAVVVEQDGQRYYVEKL